MDWYLYVMEKLNYYKNEMDKNQNYTNKQVHIFYY